ncbi:MAG: N-methyl-L-tryptophan oxidase [Opitutaceae bacterium]
MHYDVIVLGLGGMGSATAYQVARRGRRVLGLEQFGAAHDRGSSHGRTRVIRQSYYEDPAYVPLLLRAYELWREIEAETGADLLREVGGLMLGTEASDVVRGSLRSARTHGLEHELLDAEAIRRRFPALRPGSDTVALYERKAGFLRPEDSVRAHLARAASLGAELRFQEAVLGWEPKGSGVKVTTAKGTYEADRLVVSPGPWAPAVLADLRLPLVVERQVLYWFDPVGGVAPFSPDHFPIFLWEIEGGLVPYGFPATDGPRGGVKVAYYRAPVEEPCTPETIDRTVRAGETEHLRTTLRGRIPALDSPCLQATTCLYTTTPDKAFVLAVHPTCPQVSVACGFSGHGFKFCSVVGEIMADLALAGGTRHDIGLFRPDRLRPRGDSDL